MARPDALAGRGASAGGLLIGAVANQAPALFAALVAQVPFVDVVTTMLDDSIPLTVGEWEEWGNPLADEAAYRRMLSYSPYDNVTDQTYPDLLVTAGLNDPRVAYWEPAKWVAKLPRHVTGDADPAPHRARRRPRRAVGPLRRLARRGARARVPARCARRHAGTKLRLKGDWAPGGSVTGAPSTVAANEPGAPATTVSGPVAAMVCDCPAERTLEKSTLPPGAVAWTQHSPLVAARLSE